MQTYPVLCRGHFLEFDWAMLYYITKLRCGRKEFAGPFLMERQRLQKIKVEDLEIGMFIADIGLPWFKHPFLTKKKKIVSEDQIQKLKDSGILEIYIDPDKGLSIASGRFEKKDSTPSAGPSASEIRAKEASSYTAVETGRTVEMGDRTAATGPTDDVKAGDPQVSVLEEIARNVEEKTSRKKTPPLKILSSAEEIEISRTVRRDAQVLVRDIMHDIRMGKNIDSGRVKRVVNNMIDSIFRNQDAMIGLSRIRGYDEYTFVHSVDVCVLCLTLGRHLDFNRDKLQQIGIGALLHDTGKMKVPNHILNKPGRLTQDEFEEIKKHPVYGAEILESAGGIPEESKEVTLRHHERYNGKGYPYGLKAEEIGYFGQLAAITDVYDAVTSDRCYGKAILPYEGIRKIYEGAKEEFNQLFVERFIQCIGIYPVGTLVQLDTWEIGIVFSINHEIVLRPHVLLVRKDSGKSYEVPALVDLTERAEDQQRFKRTILRPLDPQKWDLNISYYLDNFDWQSAKKEDR
jgi:HD-GYP domain-containing protein (c-di-GMP phosphodiesterase class II)